MVILSNISFPSFSRKLEFLQKKVGIGNPLILHTLLDTLRLLLICTSFFIFKEKVGNSKNKAGNVTSLHSYNCKHEAAIILEMVHWYLVIQRVDISPN